MAKEISTTTKLEQALQKIQEGITLLKAARDENKTLRGHYNIDEDIIGELERITTNPKGFQGRFTTIEEILDNYGDTWFDLQDEDYECKAMEYDD
jgi:hypothetical protein